MHKTIKNHKQNIIQPIYDILNIKINRKETNIYYVILLWDGWVCLVLTSRRHNEAVIFFAKKGVKTSENLRSTSRGQH